MSSSETVSAGPTFTGTVSITRECKNPVCIDGVTRSAAEWADLDRDHKRLLAILNDRSDVTDGDEGRQLPNEAMSILTEFENPLRFPSGSPRSLETITTDKLHHILCDATAGGKCDCGADGEPDKGSL